ncbi:alpha/beta hydrolase [Sporolactobacillus sp. THM7-7]|nr:alpha/beta hydrolase [Sporolactobacillus sp. THM7-7]
MAAARCIGMKKSILLWFVPALLFGVSFYLAGHFLEKGKSASLDGDLGADQIEGRQAVASVQERGGKYVPTVFIHGWKGGERSFRTMLDRLSHRFDGPEKAMVVRIDPDGKVMISGRIRDQAMPLVQVIFMENHASMQRQGTWLRHAFSILKNREGIARMNVVSHSMGGKAFTYYLESIENPNHYPVTEKYVAIAAPFDWIDGPLDDSAYTIDQLKTKSVLYQNRGRIQKDLNVLAIAGVMKNHKDGDGVVSIRGAFFGKYFFDPASYAEKIVYGPEAQHSRLHENPEVDKLVAQFLWGIQPKG